MEQQALINEINKTIPEANAVLAEVFYGQGTNKGIWLRVTSEDCAKDGKRIFDYYAKEGKEIHPKISKIIKKAGWYVEPHDHVTCILYPD
jgi:hypothetical protein